VQKLHISQDMRPHFFEWMSRGMSKRSKAMVEEKY
jgi:hypothetical protein